MNDQQLEKKVQQDAEKVKKDFNALVEDTAARLSRFEDQASKAAGKAKADLTTKVEDGVSQLSEGLGKLTSDARETVVDTAATVKKDVGHRLRLLNAQANNVLHKSSNDAARKAAIFSWVGVSLALVIGFLAGYFLLKPTQHPVG